MFLVLSGQAQDLVSNGKAKSDMSTMAFELGASQSVACQADLLRVACHVLSCLVASASCNIRGSCVPTAIM